MDERAGFPEAITLENELSIKMKVIGEELTRNSSAGRAEWKQ